MSEELWSEPIAVRIAAGAKFSSLFREIQASAPVPESTVGEEEDEAPYVWHGPTPLRMGSVNWEPDLLDELNILSARRKVPKQAIHNVLLRRFLESSEQEQADVLTEAREWNRQRR